jgi:hypothetical protein
VSKQTNDKLTDLGRFLLKIATDPEALAAFASDPAGLMAREQVPEMYRAALASGDAMQIHTLVVPGLSVQTPDPTGQTQVAAASLASVVNAGPQGAAAASAPYHQWYGGWLWTHPGTVSPVPSAPAG